MHHRITYTIPATEHTAERVVNVTNGTEVVSLVVRTDYFPGIPNTRVSVSLDVETAVTIAADLLMHALNLDAGVHAGQSHALDVARQDGTYGTPGYYGSAILSDVRQLFASYAERIADARQESEQENPGPAESDSDRRARETVHANTASKREARS